MRIITWNVNSIRTRLERLLKVLERHEPDIVCLQELKVIEEDFPSLDLKQAGFGRLGKVGVQARLARATRSFSREKRRSRGAAGALR